MRTHRAESKRLTDSFTHPRLAADAAEIHRDLGSASLPGGRTP
ncbi:hypothetical protein [Streptomyces salinarius]|nr:hypothetical protein [Streptomyces salinarius]